MHHVEAEVIFVSQGGRNHPVSNGYSSTIKLETGLWSARLNFPSLLSGEQLELGVTCIAQLRFLFWESIRAHLKVGTEFDITEGLKLVGKGKVLKIS